MGTLDPEMIYSEPEKHELRLKHVNYISSLQYFKQYDLLIANYDSKYLKLTYLNPDFGYLRDILAINLFKDNEVKNDIVSNLSCASVYRDERIYKENGNKQFNPKLIEMFKGFKLERLESEAFKVSKYLTFDDLMPKKKKFEDFIGRSNPLMYRNFFFAVDNQGNLFFMLLDLYIILFEYLLNGWDNLIDARA